MSQAPKVLPRFSLTSPLFLAGKSGAACALALLLCQALAVPDLVTAAFVAILCCSPGALMGLHTSLEQLVGSTIGGLFGTVASLLLLPQSVGVPLAVMFAVLCTHGVGFARGTVAASFTALFVQIVTFGDAWHTLAFRLGAVGVAAVSAFMVNVAVSAFFYRSLFRKRLDKVEDRIEALVLRAAEQGPSSLYPAFAALNQLNHELSQALQELGWRRNQTTQTVLVQMQRELVWWRSYVHLLVDLDRDTLRGDADVLHFLKWLPAQEGPAPQLPEVAQATGERILGLLQELPGKQ